MILTSPLARSLTYRQGHLDDTLTYTRICVDLSPRVKFTQFENFDKKQTLSEWHLRLAECYYVKGELQLARDELNKAIAYAKAAKTPIIVAINKKDRVEFNANTVIQQLMGQELVIAAFGGAQPGLEAIIPRVAMLRLHGALTAVKDRILNSPFVALGGLAVLHRSRLERRARRRASAIA